LPVSTASDRRIGIVRIVERVTDADGNAHADERERPARSPDGGATGKNDVGLSLGSIRFEKCALEFSDDSASRKNRLESAMDCNARRIEPREVAVFLMLLWGASLFAIWTEMGLFTWIGVDYGLFSAAAELLTSDTPEAAYDLNSVAVRLEPFRAYYKGQEDLLRIGPVPHLPLTILSYVPFARFSPLRGYLLWVALNLLLATVVVRGLAARFSGDRHRAITAMALCYFPLVYTLLLGQPMVLIFFAFDRAYRAWESGRDFVAGLWTGALFLKVQYLPILVLVLACKGRRASLAGIATTSSLIALTSIAVFGDRVTTAYLESLGSVSGFREVHPIVSPQQMINWRGVLDDALPRWVSEAEAKGLALLLSALTACSLAVVWRGEWNPTGPEFPKQMLATLLVTMIATYHNHIHGALLLLVPAMALWARGGGTSPLPWLLRLGLIAPILCFAAHPQAEAVAILFFGLMLTTLIAIVWTSQVTERADGDCSASTSPSRPLLQVGRADVARVDVV
jgi:hypothetical protein